MEAAKADASGLGFPNTSGDKMGESLSDRSEDGRGLLHSAGGISYSGLYRTKFASREKTTLRVRKTVFDYAAEIADHAAAEDLCAEMLDRIAELGGDPLIYGDGNPLVLPGSLVPKGADVDGNPPGFYFLSSFWMNFWHYCKSLRLYLLLFCLWILVKPDFNCGSKNLRKLDRT